LNHRERAIGADWRSERKTCVAFRDAHSHYIVGHFGTYPTPEVGETPYIQYWHFGAVIAPPHTSSNHFILITALQAEWHIGWNMGHVHSA
jgi:hypothetical protein